jgi:hypothetical protein
LVTLGIGNVTRERAVAKSRWVNARVDPGEGLGILKAISSELALLLTRVPFFSCDPMVDLVEAIPLQIENNSKVIADLIKNT